MSHEKAKPSSPPQLENDADISPVDSDDGENRQAEASKLKRKHTPHVVTEAIVNDDLRPKLPKVSSKKKQENLKYYTTCAVVTSDIFLSCAYVWSVVYCREHYHLCPS